MPDVVPSAGFVVDPEPEPPPAAGVSRVYDPVGPWTPAVTASAAPSICTDVADAAFVQYATRHDTHPCAPPVVDGRFEIAGDWEPAAWNETVN